MLLQFQAYVRTHTAYVERCKLLNEKKGVFFKQIKIVCICETNVSCYTHTRQGGKCAHSGGS